MERKFFSPLSVALQYFGTIKYCSLYVESPSSQFFLEGRIMSYNLRISCDSCDHFWVDWIPRGRARRNSVPVPFHMASAWVALLSFNCTKSIKIWPCLVTSPKISWKILSKGAPWAKAEVPSHFMKLGRNLATTHTHKVASKQLKLHVNHSAHDLLSSQLGFGP